MNTVDVTKFYAFGFAVKFYTEEGKACFVKLHWKLKLDVHSLVWEVAFHSGNVVPEIDFTNDPLLQGRLFSYTDT